MSTTHCSWSNVVVRSVAMSGSATFTIVTSISSMNVPVQIATSGSHLRSDPPCPRPAARNRIGLEIPDTRNARPGLRLRAMGPRTKGGGGGRGGRGVGVHAGAGRIRDAVLSCRGGPGAGVDPPREQALSLVRMRAVERFV